MTNEQMSKSANGLGYVWFGEGWPADEVGTSVKALFQTAPGYWLSYRADRTYFERWDPDDAVQQVSLWPQGRVFGRNLELRWEQRERGYAVWLLAENKSSADNLPGLQPLVGQWQVAEYDLAPLFLWGSYNQAERHWIEVKIPEFQYYPALPPGKEAGGEQLFARLQAVYYQTESGAAQFTRLKGLS